MAAADGNAEQQHRAEDPLHGGLSLSDHQPRRFDHRRKQQQYITET